MTEPEPALIPHKVSLLDEALAQYDIRSIVDLGGCWGVHGGYMFGALRHDGIERAVIVDGRISPMTRERSTRWPQLELIEAALGDEETVERVGHVDAAIMFDILLHQVAPDWDEFIARYARQVDTLIIYNQGWLGPTTIRFPDFSLGEYIERVYHTDTDRVRAWYEKHQEMNEGQGKRWRDVHYFWQWGITQANLVEALWEHGYRIDHLTNHGLFTSRFPEIHNVGVIARKRTLTSPRVAGAALRAVARRPAPRPEQEPELVPKAATGPSSSNGPVPSSSPTPHPPVLSRPVKVAEGGLAISRSRRKAMEPRADRDPRVPRLVKRMLHRLPGRCEEAALGMLRSARALVSGDRVPRRVVPAAPAGGEVAGRWLRDVSPTRMAVELLDREGTDATEAAAVRSAWLLVDAHERLSRAGAMRVFGQEVSAGFRYAKDSLRALASPEPGSLANYESDENRLRFRRVLDFTRPGDAVFDVGFGRGYLAGLMLRDCGIASYHGIDIEDEHLGTTLAVLAANGFTEDRVHLRTADLFALTSDDLAGASFVTCCEVLEHVGDPEGALMALAAAIPKGADLLFSVPMFGRLESTWGHRTVFDVSRLKGMLSAAGLVAHHIEPLANTWAVVMASRDPGPSTRVREAARPPATPAQPLSASRDFVYVDTSDMTAAGTAELKNDKVPVTLRIDGPQGGLSFPVKSLQSLRLWLRGDLNEIERLNVRVNASDKVVGSWTCQPSGSQVAERRWQFALRPGESSRHISAGRNGRLEDADRVEILADVPSGAATFMLKAAYLP